MMADAVAVQTEADLKTSNAQAKRIKPAGTRTVHPKTSKKSVEQNFQKLRAPRRASILFFL